MNRTVSRPGRIRGAGTTLASAAVAALVITGCSSAPSGDDAAAGSEAAEEAAPEPVRFDGLPNACRTIAEDTVADVVPGTDDDGEELPTDNVNTTSTCLWSGLDDYDFRSLTVTLKRFDSDVALGSGDQRAAQYLQAQTAEVTGADGNESIVEEDLADVGDEGVSLSYAAEKESGDTVREFQQQRVVVRTGNVVVTVDYAGAGFEDADLPSAEEVQDAAELVATETTASVDATEGEEAAEDEDGDAADDGDDGDDAEESDD